jgi:putative restriction endonuclease
MVAALDRFFGPMMATSDQWLAKLARLRVDRATGDPAPHKPLLLLTVLELAEQGLLTKQFLPLTPELAFRFFGYWTVVSRRRRQRPDIRLPFHYLQTDGFWSSLSDQGKRSTHPRLTRFVEIPSDLVAVVGDPAWRDRARRVLVETYFRPSEKLALYELMGMPVPNKAKVASELAAAARADAANQGREARFRLTVIPAYGYACALTGYRLTTITAASIVDAAHIHQFSDSRNNDPKNGIALCKNAHWLFDQGLWSLTDDYRVIVAVGRFSEDCPDQKGLLNYHGERVRLPIDQSLWPNPIHLSWHREKKLQKA